MLQPRDGYRTLSGRRAVVVGAGPGGLAVALMLARDGVQVTVSEKEGSVGGRTRAVTAPGGYKFDIGPTFFLYPRILADIFESCGERLEDHVRLERLDPQPGVFPLDLTTARDEVDVTWAPTEKLSLQASYLVDEAAPSLNQLGNPTLISSNVVVYDFTRGETALGTCRLKGD